MTTDGDAAVVRDGGPLPDRCAYCGVELEPGYGLTLDLRHRGARAAAEAPAAEASAAQDAGHRDHADGGDPDAGGPSADHAQLTFCTQRHAARWLDGDAPPIAVRLPPRAPLALADRVTVGAVALAVAVLVGLTLVGAWTVGRWLF